MFRMIKLLPLGLLGYYALRNKENSQNENTAMNQLNQRFIDGEIDETTYTEMKAKIQK